MWNWRINNRKWKLNIAKLTNTSSIEQDLTSICAPIFADCRFFCARCFIFVYIAFIISVVFVAAAAVDALNCYAFFHWFRSAHLKMYCEQSKMDHMELRIRTKMADGVASLANWFVVYVYSNLFPDELFMAHNICDWNWNGCCCCCCLYLFH